jgi:aspartyl-tRNA(Asn)/glutamyl-tRNA(Gln) amidotransferase subunit C
MSHSLTKKDLEHLAELARIKLEPKEEAKLLKDLGAILAHFESLKELDTTNVAPLTGGTALINVFRADAERENTNQGEGTESFPEKQEEYLKVPPVFSAEGGSLPVPVRQAGASGGE